MTFSVQSFPGARIVLGMMLGWLALAGQAQSPAIPEPAKAGQEIAVRLRNAGPEKSVSLNGTMTILRPGRTNTLPIHSRIVVNSTNATNWQVHYTAGAHPPVETLTIVHTPGQPNTYFVTLGTNAPSTVPLTAAELYQPFAGSDFWRADLGLEFLAWAQQRQTGNAMSRSRACRILESSNTVPVAGAYSRVVSWVDVDGDGILKAHAFDHRNKMIKEFLPGAVRKVNGQYELEEMKMRVPNSRDETKIRFDPENRSAP